MQQLRDNSGTMSPMPDTIARRMNQIKVRFSNLQRIAMPIFQRDEFKVAALLGAVMVATFSPSVACAALGEPESTVQSDVAQLRAAMKSTEERIGYRVHEIELPSGTLLREFVGPDGNVFAVAWKGPQMPNLRQAFGRYFDIFAAAPRSKFTDHKHLQVQQGDLVVQSSGHTLTFSGRAYLASAVPSGVSLGDLH
jgi:hypothetical protein